MFTAVHMHVDHVCTAGARDSTDMTEVTHCTDRLYVAEVHLYFHTLGCGPGSVNGIFGTSVC